MKNRIVICFVLLSVLIAGCAYSADEEDNIKADSAASIEEMEILLNAENFGINVYDCVFQRTEQIDLIDIQIHYPQIRFSNENGYRTPKILNKINRQIFEYVVLEDYFTWSDSRYNASVRYEISYVGNDYLSIIFEGDNYEFSLEKIPSMLNFDLRTGEIISLEDYIEKDVVKERLAEDIGCIQEGEFIDMVGGREGVKEYLEAYLSEEGPLYDFAITEEGLKFIIYPEWSLGKEYYIADVFMQETAFFYPMDKDEIEVDVQCELHIIDIFSGNATLRIRKLPDTKLDNYFEIVLTNLQGKCDNHGDIDSTDCEYTSDFPIGYFYVDGKNIYMMGHYEEYFEIFMDTEVFPPTEEFLEIWNQKQREHYGYFEYRLVCTEEGLEDRYTIQNNYHEFIAVDGDVRKYNLYPEELMGTQEYMYITWNHGITYFATWSGNQKLYKSFWVQENNWME